MSLSSKSVFALLLLALGPALEKAEASGLEVPLQVKSRFIVRAEEGPPSDRQGISRYASCYLFKFTTLKYRREISFSENGSFVVERDYYGEYELPSFETQSLSTFVSYRRQYTLNDSWKSDLKTAFGKSSEDENKSAVQIQIPWEPPKAVQNIIGEGKSNIKVTGSRSISFSGRSEWEDNLVNTGTFKQSKFPTLQMEQVSRFKVTGTVGSKITVEVDQDSKRDVELANTIKLRYKGGEDEILQSIEAGNTTLSLPNAQLIGYSTNVQGLFGIKATAKVGNLDMTVITSQEKGTSEKTTFNAGARGSEEKIRDFEYLGNTYFWLDVPHGSLDSLLKVELYVRGRAEARDPHGIACVSPNGQVPNVTPADSSIGEYEYGLFTRYEGGDPTQFDLNKTSWYIVLNKPLQSNEILAAYIEYGNYVQGPNNVDTIKIGNLSYHPGTGDEDTTFVLQLLKHSSPLPSYRTWNRMWRNVYDLGSRNLSPDGFTLKIYKGTPSNSVQITDPEDENGRCFITLLGLDKTNQSNNNAPGSDCVFDFANTMIDTYRGHLIFPEQWPFMSDSLQTKVPIIYNHTYDPAVLDDSSKYYIYVKSAQRASTFPLGRANIMPNSEVVKLGDGTVLRRDVDYTINYDIGQITFLSEQALNPAANVTVDFEYAPFFMPEKKNLFGMAAQYKLLENSNISLAAMYRSESASEPRPRVGREPRRGFVWDSNFSFNFKPEFMTNLVDALPFVEADAPSALEISGEVAQSFPNPNIKNEAFIDDFEGSRSYTDLSTRRGIWTVGSPPLDSLSNKRDRNRKGKIWWYNPFDQLHITDIWPNRRNSIKTEEDRIDVMFLKYFPDTAGVAIDPDSSWGGIMRPFFAGVTDQQLSKFIEIWYYPDSALTTSNPTLNIDLGSISEDINDNGHLDSEDRQSTGSIGTFEPDQEDTGLDGVYDASEPGYNGDQSSPNYNPDPSGDDWIYDTSNDNRYDYSHINGTEGNNFDPDRRGRFDTEDLNGNSALNNQNGYFEYTVHMNNPEYLADSTTSGWKLLRIPLQDSTVYRVRGNRDLAKDFSAINYARLWFTGSRDPYQIVIASLQIVGNKWQETGVVKDTTDYLRPGEKIEVTIKNTQENANYFPPPGVEGNLNRDTGIREKEQSLVLAYQNLAPGHLGGAYWSLYSPDDYTQYQRLKMYVHGDTSVSSGVPDHKVTFFLRLSQDGNNFYEYHTVLDTGWSESNWVDVDFARMTELKYEIQRVTPAESLSVADTTDGHYRVRGNPSLSQVRWFIVGLEMAVDAPEGNTGEVWIDELRVSDIRRKSDFAGRIQATARFSDFFDVSASYGRTGADFYPLSAQRPAGSTNTSTGLRLNVRVDKLLPPSLGLSLPVTVGWQNTLALPRLKTGSDIILQPAAREFEKSESKAFNYTITQSFSRNTSNWLWNLTMNRIRTSYTYSRTENLSPISPIDRRDTYKGNGSYDLTPRAKPTIKPLFWTKYLFLPKKLYDSPMAYLPTQLSFSGEVNGTKTTNVNQRGIVTGTRIRDLMLTGNTAFSLFSSLRTSYNASSSRDISQPGRFKLSINPSKLKLGQQRNFTQRFETSFQPRIITLIDNRFSFNSSYGENSDFSRNLDSTRTTQMTGTFKTDLTFNIQNLLGSRGKGNRPTPPPNQPDKNLKGPNQPLNEEEKQKALEEAGGEKEEPTEENQSHGNTPGSPKWTWRQITTLFRSIKPVRASYTKDKRFNQQGLIERPSWQYMFGLADNPHARVKTSTGLSAPNQTVFSDSYELDSGLQPGHGLDITSGYSLRKTTTRSTNDPQFTRSTTFPDITANLSGLEKFVLFRKISSTVGLQSGYSKKVDENGQAVTGELYKRDMAKTWAPLAGLNLTMKNDIRVSLRYDLTKNISKNLRSEGQAKRDVYGTDNTFKISISYSFSAPKGMKLPLLKRVKFNSQLSMNLDITMRNTKSESITDGNKALDSQRSQMVIEPRLTYQFSRAITGGIRGRWDDSDDKIQKRKHHIRELGITAEIRF